MHADENIAISLALCPRFLKVDSTCIVSSVYGSKLKACTKNAPAAPSSVERFCASRAASTVLDTCERYSNFVFVLVISTIIFAVSPSIQSSCVSAIFNAGEMCHLIFRACSTSGLISMSWMIR